MQPKVIKIEVLAPGTKVFLNSDREIKTEIRDVKIEVFKDADDDDKILHIEEYGLAHAMNKVYPVSQFTVIPDDTPAAPSVSDNTTDAAKTKNKIS